MAVTSTRVVSLAEDGTRMVHATVLMDSSYPTGGEVITPNDLGLVRITGAIVGNAVDATPEAFCGSWDQTNKKLLVFAKDGTTGMAQVADTTSLAALTFNCIFFGV